MIHRFHVTAFWDPEARVWCSESDIKGLVIETETLNEFEEIMDELAADMIEANHLRPMREAGSNEREVVVVTWERPPVRIARPFVEAA